LANAYLLKDIISFDGIRNSGKVMGLLKLLAFQMGKEVSLQELGKQLGMSKTR
jgi:predicted AAA+ superfamily ATPase